MAIQAQIPPALCAIHNFIRVHDTDEIHEFGQEIDDDTLDFNPDVGGNGDLAHGPAGAAEKTRAALKRDQIAQAMWDSYQTALQSGRYDIWE
jgi:hypothetical protein